MKINRVSILIGTVLFLLILAWAPWLNDQEIHDIVFREKAYKDGTMGWVTYPNGTEIYKLICDYKVTWFPFGRLVISCEGGYYITFWNQIIP